MKLTFNGAVNFNAGLLLSDSTTGTRDEDGRFVENGGLDRDYDFSSRVTMSVRATNTTDSGLTYGGHIEFDQIDRRNDVVITDTFVFVRDGFGTFTLGDAGSAAGDFAYFFVPVSEWDRTLGRSAAGGKNLDGAIDRVMGPVQRLFDPAGETAVADTTRIKYTSPSFNGFSFAMDFAPVAGGVDHGGSGGRNDLFDDDTTNYENVASFGVRYEDQFGAATVAAAATALYGNGVRRVDNPLFESDDGNPDNNLNRPGDLEGYSLGGRIAIAPIAASLSWTHQESSHRTDKAVDSIIAGLAWTPTPFLVSAGFAYTWAEAGNGFESAFTDGVDFDTEHYAALTLGYNLAPGLNPYVELAWKRQSYRIGRDFETAALISGISLAF